MERRKKRIVKLTAFLFLLAASIFVMPQKAFADENEDVTLPTGDIKPMEPQQDESGIDTYGADEGDEFSGTEYELYTVLENRVKEAMLAGNEWVSIKDLKIRRDTYDLSFYYGYSPYFPSDTYNRIIAWYGDAILNPWNHSRMSPGLIHTGPMKAMSSAERSMNCIRFWRIV